MRDPVMSAPPGLLILSYPRPQYTAAQKLERKPHRGKLHADGQENYKDTGQEVCGAAASPAGLSELSRSSTEGQELEITAPTRGADIN